MREWRSRFRRDHAYVLLSVLVVAAAWSMMSQLNSSTPDQGLAGGVQALAPLSQDLLVQLVWTQIVGVCLLAPMHSAPLIARERESGSSEHLLLAPLSPLRLVLEKWVAGAIFLLVVLLALWPLNWVALLLGNSSIAGLWCVALVALGCLAWGSALGVACSAHARRAALALRSATGLTIFWLVVSLVCSVLAGEAPRLSSGAGSIPAYLAWFGRTNPVLCALDLLQPSPFLSPKWPVCAAFLALGTPLLLWVACLGVRKPLPELQMIAPNKGGKGGVSGALARLEMPLVGRFAPSNPVLARESRGKFRLRQPPLAVLISEIVLVLGVGVIYLMLARKAVIDPSSRLTIFWGVAWTGFVVSVLAACSQGGAALARERENGTWDALQLSLLNPSQIVRGKLFAALATMVLLSLPAWPLLLLCVRWDGTWFVNSAYKTALGVQPVQLVAAILIWSGTLWLQTLISLFISTRAKRAGSAIAGATGAALIWMFGWMLLLVLNLTPGSRSNDIFGLIAIVNPLISLAIAGTSNIPPDLFLQASGWPFAFFALLVGGLLLSLIEAEVHKLMQGERNHDWN